MASLARRIAVISQSTENVTGSGISPQSEYGGNSSGFYTNMACNVATPVRWPHCILLMEHDLLAMI